MSAAQCWAVGTLVVLGMVKARVPQWLLIVLLPLLLVVTISLVSSVMAGAGALEETGWLHPLNGWTLMFGVLWWMGACAVLLAWASARVWVESRDSR